MSGGKEDVQKTQRSVFVGNIPYEATEEQLKEIFEQVGPVVSFRIVYDRESGKPKGYGFCEYQDTETAKSAMRNLNDHDFHGRALRVGHAAGETSNAEKAVSQAITGPPEEPMYGDPVEPGKAPEAISRAVASLPPEQMFELMKQMKMCIQNNPNEARNMLLQNPQLAYALLQAQIVMKIVDPQVALAMLHRQSEQIPPLVPSSTEETPATSKPAEPVVATPQPAATSATPVVQPALPAQPKLQDVDHRQHMQQPQQQQQQQPPSLPANQGLPVTQTPTVPPAAAQMRGGPVANTPMSGGGGAVLLQTPPQQPQQPQPQPTSMGGLQPLPQSAGMVGSAPMGSQPNQPPVMAMANTGMGGPVPPRPGLLGDRPGAPAQFDRNRGPGYMDRGGPGQSNAPVGPGGGGPGGPGFPPGGPGAGGGRADPRDPRSGRMGPGGPVPGMGGPRPGGPGPNMGGPRPPVSTPGANQAGAGSGITSQDQEKAQLIMQVLQLSDEQIAMLPPDQRQSILILKEQIAKSTNP